MALPSKYKKNIDIGLKRKNLNYFETGQMESGQAENLKDSIIDKDTYLPKGIVHKDLDAGFKDFIKNQVNLSLDGVTTPVMMIGIQKWGEFQATWGYSDEYENLKIPFITIVRNPDTKVGSNPSLIYNIPNNATYTYATVPTWDGNKRGADIYKIPQPIPIDIFYDVKIFSYRQKELNKFNLNVMKLFQSNQAYTKVNGHYIPIVLEEIEDESQLDDLSKKRYYVQNYRFNLQGFILDPDDFEVVPAIDRVIIKTNESELPTHNKVDGLGFGLHK